MAEVWVPVIVAIIMGPLVAIIRKLRRENSSQHTESRILLHHIGRKVDKVDEKLDKHIEWHLDKKE